MSSIKEQVLAQQGQYKESDDKYLSVLKQYNCNLNDEEIAAAVKKILDEKVAENETMEVKKFLFGSIAFFEEFIKNLKFFGHGVAFFIIFHPFFLRAKVSDNNFGLFGVVPKVWSEGFFFLVRYFDKFLIDVKDTSLTRPGVQ